MGFKAMFYQRQNFDEKKERLRKKEMEVLWEPSFIQREKDAKQTHKEQLFVHMFYEGYQGPGIHF